MFEHGGVLGGGFDRVGGVRDDAVALGTVTCNVGVQGVASPAERPEDIFFRGCLVDVLEIVDGAGVMDQRGDAGDARRVGVYAALIDAEEEVDGDEHDACEGQDALHQTRHRRIDPQRCAIC